MDARRILAVILLIGGILGLVYGGFSYTSEKHEAHIGPIDLSVKEKKHVNIPLWVGVGAIVVGGALLIPRSRS